MRAALTIYLISCLTSFAWCQAPGEPDPEQFSDDMIGDRELDGVPEDAYENLVQVLSSPLDLNRVTTQELELLHILNDTQIDNFIRYRSEQGPLLDVYELQVIEGFDAAIVSRLQPFVKVTDPHIGLNKSLLQRMFSPGHSYVVSRYERTLQQKKGFLSTPGTPPVYQGSPDKLYFRFRTVSPCDFSVGITGEKDAGERMAISKNHPLGFDFTSFHLQLQNKGKLTNLIVGDFQAQFGQGLLFGGPFGLGKGGETVLSARKSNVGFLPYTSVNESAYQRGLAFTLAPTGSLLVCAFYSGARRDAGADSASSQSVTSLQTSGYHRTASEIENSMRQRERNYGVALQWRKNKLEAGIIINEIHFGLPVRKTPSRYNQFAFQGTDNLNAGGHFQYRRRNISVFGEAAQSLHAGRGFLAGILMNPDTHLDLAILWRTYDRDFYTFYSNAFSENTQPQNERGLYWGLKYQWTKALGVTGYADLFSFPWLSFRRYAPSEGYEWMLRANYNPTRAASLFIQLREECKARNEGTASPVYRVAVGRKRNLTVSCDYGSRGNIRMKSRLQCSDYLFDGKNSRGFTLVQDVSFSVGPFRFTGRHALFDTDDLDNRQYVYEADAWLAFSFPAYSGAGVRNYLLIEYKAAKNLTLWARFAATHMQHGDEIGSGGDLIAGNTRNDVKFQARLTF